MELDPTKNYGFVAYTDGGARPNPGHVGNGVHGYFYDKDAEVKKTVVIANRFGDVLTYVFPSTKGYITCTKDGRAINPESKAIPVTPLFFTDHLAGSMDIGSNNQAEIISFTRALEIAGEKDVKSVHILADSQYTLSGVELRIKQQLYITPREIPNSDLWNVLMAAQKVLVGRGVQLTFEYVKAHNNDVGNSTADWLATIAILRSRDNIRNAETAYSPSKGYWDPTVARHSFLNFKRLYFNRLAEYNRPGQYYLADPGGVDDHIGKRTPDSGYAVVRLKNPCPIVESVRDRQFQFGQEVNAIMVAQLDRIFEKDVYRYINAYGKYCMMESDKGLNNVVFLDKTPITMQQYPMGQMMRALDILAYIEGFLDDFETADKNVFKFNTIFGGPMKYMTDITPMIYNKIEKKRGKEVVELYEIKKEFSTSHCASLLELEVMTQAGMQKVKFPLLMGLDSPNRNQLKRLEESKPNVYLITWSESARSLRYACIIESAGDIGIWSNFFADRIMLS